MAIDRPEKTRREFLSQASFAVAGVSLSGEPRGWGTEQGKAAPSGDTAILQRTLGRTGLKIPIVSMGVMNANNPEVVRRAYETGVRLFDTAQSYQGGRNEEMVGSVIAQLGVRDKVVIQTKVRFPRGTTGRGDRVLADLAACLKRLQTTYIDIFMIHQPSVEEMNHPEVVDALREAKRQKTVRFIGVSQHQGQAATLESAAATGIYDVVLVGFNFTNTSDQEFLPAIRHASAKGIGVIAMKTQTGGRIRNLGALNQTAMLKWVLQHGEITTAIPGYTTFDQLNESFSVASGLEYTSDEKAWLGTQNIKVALGFCQQCGFCLSTCPRGVDIPRLMRTHMYAASYSNFDQARVTLDEIPATASLGNCVDCGSCLARCANSVRIAERISELKTIYA